jgi:hypothetical protein
VQLAWEIFSHHTSSRDTNTFLGELLPPQVRTGTTHTELATD